MKIINDSNYNSIDLLQIDTEGFDYEVLKCLILILQTSNYPI